MTAADFEHRRAAVRRQVRRDEASRYEFAREVALRAIRLAEAVGDGDYDYAIAAATALELDAKRVMGLPRAA